MSPLRTEHTFTPPREVDSVTLSSQEIVQITSAVTGSGQSVSITEALSAPSDLHENASSNHSATALEESTQTPAAHNAFVQLAGISYADDFSKISWLRDGQRFEAWTNVDISLLQGVYSFRRGDTQFSILPIIGASSMTALNNDELTDVPKTLSTLPAISEGAAFIVTGFQEPSEDQLAPIYGLFEIYLDHLPQLKLAAEARDQAEADRAAYLEAHPPSERPITIHFWKK